MAPAPIVFPDPLLLSQTPDENNRGFTVLQIVVTRKVCIDKSKAVTCLQFYMCLLTNSNLTPQIGIVFVTEKESISAHENITEPFKDVCIIHYLVLNELLGDGEQHL
jgi:hypothetical protein